MKKKREENKIYIKKMDERLKKNNKIKNSLKCKNKKYIK